MGRILLAWEMGGNFGHLAQLHTVAAALKKDGQEVVFAVRDLTHAHRLLGRDGYRIVAAPAPPLPRRPLVPDGAPNSYLEILAMQGMADVDCLAAVMSAWQDLFAIGRFDVLLAESAPFAVLAASLCGLPHVAIGTGFTLPPTNGPLPLFRHELAARKHQRLRTEADLLSALNKVARSKGGPSFERAGDLFRSARRYLVTWPELDHYGRTTPEAFVGPLPTMSDLHGDVQVDWPEGDRRLVAYLQADYPNLDVVMQTLSERGFAAIVVIPGGESWHQRYATARMKVLTGRASFNVLLPTADIVVFHGSHNLAVEALCCGKPLLMLPQQIEQAMLSRRLEHAGFGIALSPAQGQRIPSALSDLCEGPHSYAAGRFAETRRRYDAHATAFGIARDVLAEF